MSVVTTYTGKCLDLLDPQPDQICLKDIVHSLSNMCRYGGHCNRYYSVAEHSVNCYYFALHKFNDPILAKGCLFHDASEAYCIDIPRNLKKLLGTNYSDIENKIQEVISKKYEVQYPFDDRVHWIDDTLLATEAPQLGFDSSKWNINGAKPVELIKLDCVEPVIARMFFEQILEDLNINYAH